MKAVNVNSQDSVRVMCSYPNYAIIRATDGSYSVASGLQTDRPFLLTPRVTGGAASYRISSDGVRTTMSQERLYTWFCTSSTKSIADDIFELMEINGVVQNVSEQYTEDYSSDEEQLELDFSFNFDSKYLVAIKSIDDVVVAAYDYENNREALFDSEHDAEMFAASYAKENNQETIVFKTVSVVAPR